MSLSELDTPSLSCGRSDCRLPHDWVGGRCPGNKAPVVINVAALAAEARDALRGAR